MRNMFSAIIALSMAAVVSVPLPALAAGSGDSAPTTTSVKKRIPKCKKGKVFSLRRKKCIKAKKSELDDNNIFLAGRQLAFDGRYVEAIEVLTLASDLNNPKILNYLGYSHRKAGRVDVGLGYYKQALAIDPDYTLVREYMGEAFLQKRDFNSAKGQLAEIRKRCGITCREYTLLATAISDVIAGRPISDASKGTW